MSDLHANTDDDDPKTLQTILVGVVGVALTVVVILLLEVLHRRTAEAEFRATSPGERANVSVGYAGETEVPPGISLTRDYRYYAGPKSTEHLLAFGAQLDRSIDLGWAFIEPITKGFVWLLRRTYEVVPNYGIAIIFLTFVLRIVMAPLTHKQMKVMKKNSSRLLKSS